MLIDTAQDLAIMARARRAELKLGQADVARAVGVGRQWIVKFEAGRESVEFGLAMRTLRALGLEMRVVFTRAPPAWTVPLTDEAGTRARPYARHRLSRQPLRLTVQPKGERLT